MRRNAGEETGAVVKGYVLDVTDAKAIREVYGEAEAALGPLSVSVRTPGSSPSPRWKT